MDSIIFEMRRLVAVSKLIKDFMESIKTEPGMVLLFGICPGLVIVLDIIIANCRHIINAFNGI